MKQINYTCDNCGAKSSQDVEIISDVTIPNESFIIMEVKHVLEMLRS